jgi:hypothetical protein
MIQLTTARPGVLDVFFKRDSRPIQRQEAEVMPDGGTAFRHGAATNAGSKPNVVRRRDFALRRPVDAGARRPPRAVATCRAMARGRVSGSQRRWQRGQ